jgi:hypothetical protein
MIASTLDSAPVQWCERPGQLRAAAEKVGVFYFSDSLMTSIRSTATSFIVCTIPEGQ